MSDDGITLTAEGAKVMASEKVSTGESENGNVSATLDVSVEGADVTEGMPQALRTQLYTLKRQLQHQVADAAEERRKEAAETAEGGA